jgi:hypothetical protein
MTQQRGIEISQLVEACHNTDNSEVESEKTAVIEEVLGEVERLEQQQPRF